MTTTTGRIEAIESECGVYFAGMQERPKSQPPVYLWTDVHTGTTIPTYSDDYSEVALSVSISRARFVKPGMFADWKQCAATFAISAVSCAIVAWMFWMVVVK